MLRKLLMSTVSAAALIAGICALEATAARADLMPGDTFAYSGYSVTPNYNVVTFTRPDSSTFQGLAGAITLHGTDPMMDLLTWCLDVTHTLQNAYTYTVGNDASVGNNGTDPADPVASSLTDAQKGEIGALINFGNSDLGDAAAVAVAIWDTEYAGTGWSVTADATTQVAADAILAMNLDPLHFLVLSDLPAVPDQLLGLINPSTVPLPGVPEPTTLALLGAGLIGIGFGARRKRHVPSGMSASAI